MLIEYHKPLLTLLCPTCLLPTPPHKALGYYGTFSLCLACSLLVLAYTWLWLRESLPAQPQGWVTPWTQSCWMQSLSQEGGGAGGGGGLEGGARATEVQPTPASRWGTSANCTLVSYS